MDNSRLLPPNISYGSQQDTTRQGITEIETPTPSNATNEIPDEIPRRDGPGGEPAK